MVIFAVNNKKVIKANLCNLFVHNYPTQEGKRVSTFLLPVMMDYRDRAYHLTLNN